MEITQPFWITCSNLWLPIMCKKFLLLPWWNFFVCSLSSFHCTAPSSLYSPSRQLKIAFILPINLPFLKGWMHPGPATSPWMSSAPVLIASVASVGLPPVCQYHCHAREAQNSGVFHRLQTAGQDPFLGLLAAPSLVQPWMEMLHCCTGALPIWCPQSLFFRAATSQLAPTCPAAGFCPS